MGKNGITSTCVEFTYELCIFMYFIKDSKYDLNIEYDTVNYVYIQTMKR